MSKTFVTHDQEEALEVADQVVIFNGGRIEQVGTPEEVYNKPANPFVLGFLGHVNIFHGRMQGGEGRLADGSQIPAGVELGDGAIAAYVRPHEIDLVRADAAGSDVKGTPAKVVWVHRAGAAVTVELEVEGTGQLVVAELARERFAELKLERGDRVMAVAKDMRVFATDYQI
jgi:sulfate transport system ATP-binding protein